MEIFQLKAFLAVAEELHFGQAAEKLGMAQPPLSRIIRQLEDELGVELFYRTTRSVRLAPAGEALVKPAMSILESVRDAENSIKAINSGEIGTVRLGFSGASSNNLIAKLITAASVAKPGIHFNLETTTYASEALAGLTEGTLDLAIARWDEKPPHLTGRPVIREQLVVGLAQDHPLAQREFLTPNDLAHERLALLTSVPRSQMRESIMKAFLLEGLTPNVGIEGPDSWITSALVSAGYGATITYDSTVSNTLYPNTVTIPFKSTIKPSYAYLAYRTDSTNPALLELLEIADKVIPSID